MSYWVSGGYDVSSRDIVCVINDDTNTIEQKDRNIPHVQIKILYAMSLLGMTMDKMQFDAV